MGAARQDVLPFFPAVAIAADKREKAKLRREDAVAGFEAAMRRAVGAHVRIGKLEKVFQLLKAELGPFEEAWKNRRKEDDRKRRAKRTRERDQEARALQAIRNGKRGEIVLGCIKAAAEVVGCERRAILKKTRGTPAEALARVVAMHACVCLGVPMQATAEAFGRCRRSVHSALAIGRGAERDARVREAVRVVMGRVRGDAERPEARDQKPEGEEQP